MTKGNNDPGTVVINYLVLAHSDYSAARFMLRNGFLEHGAMLAATAVEKYLKAVIGVNSIKNKDHLSGSLYRMVKNVQPDLYAALDHDFLKFLEKAYRLRYASTNAPGLSIVINQHRTLMALDELVGRIDQGFAITTNEGRVKTPYQNAVEAGDQRILEDNYFLNADVRRTFLYRHNLVMELKIEDDYQTVSALYKTTSVSIDGSFCKLPEISIKKGSFKLTRG
ncbi:HEPN domain-containing protein [Paracidovorax citrulli]|uniref:HEPN domain-containing protein n=1 Tax=Paracidovorax citrulli TaxID=80869 RepID=UPI00255CD175|nr:HEPN domain-containing protein [Paracidovorax citrulli]WIY36634.1 HEPN domain-containing protein [Paracidovorax citrulli]